MYPKYQVIATKVGYVVQNTRTHHIVGGVYSETQAKKICTNLNEPPKPMIEPKVYYIKEEV